MTNTKRGTGDWVDRLNAEWHRLNRLSLAALLDYCELVVQAKAAVGHGRWGRHVVAHLDYGAREAEHYLAVGRRAAAFRKRASLLPPHVTILAHLARMDPADFEAACDAGEITPVMSREDAEAVRTQSRVFRADFGIDEGVPPTPVGNRKGQEGGGSVRLRPAQPSANGARRRSGGTKARATASGQNDRAVLVEDEPEAGPGTAQTRRVRLGGTASLERARKLVGDALDRGLNPSSSADVRRFFTGLDDGELRCLFGALIDLLITLAGPVRRRDAAGAGPADVRVERLTPEDPGSLPVRVRALGTDGADAVAPGAAGSSTDAPTTPVTPSTSAASSAAPRTRRGERPKLLPTPRAQNGQERNAKIYKRAPGKPVNLENAVYDVWEHSERLHPGLDDQPVGGAPEEDHADGDGQPGASPVEGFNSAVLDEQEALGRAHQISAELILSLLRSADGHALSEDMVDAFVTQMTTEERCWMMKSHAAFLVTAARSGLLD